MDQKKFLTLLIQHKILTPDQAKHCFQLANTQKRPLDDILLEENYFTKETLRQWTHYFQNLHTIVEAIPSDSAQTESTSEPSVILPETEILQEVTSLANKTRSLKKSALSVPEKTVMETDADTSERSEPTLIESIPPKSKNASPEPTEEEDRFPLPTSSLTHESGEKTGSRYIPLKTLGEGGMGIVQLVKDSLLGREVALKTLKIKGDLSKRHKMMLWRLTREAEITAILGHPNIIQLYDLQKKPSGELYFTMPKIEGCTFTQILKLKRAGTAYQEEDQILSIFLKVCDAISYAHAKNVIHRDLKPDNIMVGQFGEVYVMDWGIAKQLEDSDENEAQLREALAGSETATHHTIGGMGTPGYMPPEQSENASQVKPQADIYALGVILRQCFTLMSPAEEMKREIKTQQKTQKRAKSDLKNTRKSNSPSDDIPPDIVAIIQKATESEWQKRYERVQDLAEDLKRYQRNLGVSVREYSAWELLQKWVQRNKQKVALAGILVLLIGVFIVYTYQQEQQRLRTEQEKIETQFKQAYQTADEEYRKAIQNDENAPNASSERIKNGLNALNASNITLQLKPKNLKAEVLKLDITKNLLTLCFETQDYNLAEYIAREMQQLSLLSTQEQNHYLIQVGLEKNKTLQDHLKRFDEWVHKLSKGDYSMKSGEEQYVIFEIAKMQEKEIHKKLIQILNEGTDYFLNNKNRTPQMDGFYVTMVTALGSLENPLSKEPLVHSLRTVATYVLANNKKEEIIKVADQEELMVTLVQALANSKIRGVAEEVMQLRKSVGDGRRFYRKSEDFYVRLALLDGIKVQTQFLETIPSSTDPETPLSTENLPNKKTAEDYFQSGKKKHDLNDFEGAIQDFTEALKLAPKSEYYFYRGMARTQIDPRNFSGAIQDFTEILQDPQFKVAAYLNRGYAKYGNRDPQGALEDYNQHLKLAPNSADGYINRAKIWLDTQQMDKAVQDYEKAVGLKPHDAVLWSSLGSAQTQKGDLGGAIKSFTKALEIEPNLDYALDHRGNAKMAQGKIDEAIDDFDKALKINPQYWPSYNKRGDAKFRLKDYEGAIRDFTESTKYRKWYPRAYVCRGDAKLALKDIEGALIDYIHAAEECDPAPRFAANRGEAFAKAAELCQRQQKWEKALHYYTQSITHLPDNFPIYYYRGQVLYQLKKQAEAKEDFKKFLEMSKKITPGSFPALSEMKTNIFKLFPDLK